MDVLIRWESVLLFHSILFLLFLPRLFDVPNPRTKAPIPVKTTDTKMVKVNTPEASRSPMDGASYEHEGLMHLLAAAAVQRQTHVDDEPSSKPTMWDPVKDCSHTSTTQADLSGFLPDGHSSEQLTHSAVRNLPSMDLDFGYDQAQGDRQQSTNSGFRGAASLGPPPYPRSHTMGLGRFSMDSQIFHISPSYDQSRRRPQENRQPMNMELRTPASTVSNETARPQRSSPCRRTQVPTASLATAASPSTQRGSDQVGIATGHDPQQGNGPPHQSLLATTAMSQALSMAHYGESLDQQSNYTEAARAYDRACALLQEVITRSGSIEEQMECNIAVSQELSTTGRTLIVLKAEYLPSTSRRAIATVNSDSMDSNTATG